VSAGYRAGHPVISNINLELAEREFLGIIGPNGGGKTTLLKVIIGLIKPFSGEIIIEGNSGGNTRSQIGYVPQYSQFDNSYPIKVKDVVSMGFVSKSMFSTKLSDEDFLKTEEALKKVNLSSKIEHQVGHLSGGEQQRVLIARALATNPKVLILDEPTASIDKQTGSSIYELLTELNSQKTIIMVSHDIGAISRSVKKIACMNNKLVYHNTKEITKEMLEETYKCPIDLIAHGVPHRVLEHH
ncbi:MAG: ABC transporter ATP-binding protein, partial [Melioribacteraceae bacterium]|nr:ABC transporter ATP-binding protein [Melioribacteraceae bacterium]